jgi:hypothetical protein
MSVSPHARASAIFTTVATAVCCAPEPPRSAKFNSPWDNPRTSEVTVTHSEPREEPVTRPSLREYAAVQLK